MPRKVLLACIKNWLLLIVASSRERAIKVGAEQVDEWGLGYIDMYLIHFPIALQYNPECTRVSSIILIMNDW